MPKTGSPRAKGNKNRVKARHSVADGLKRGQKGHTSQDSHSNKKLSRGRLRQRKLGRSWEALEASSFFGVRRPARFSWPVASKHLEHTLSCTCFQAGWTGSAAVGQKPAIPVNIPIPSKIDCTYPKMVPLVLTHSHINSATLCAGEGAHASW